MRGYYRVASMGVGPRSAAHDDITPSPNPLIRSDQYPVRMLISLQLIMSLMMPSDMLIAVTLTPHYPLYIYVASSNNSRSASYAQHQS